MSYFNGMKKILRIVPVLAMMILTIGAAISYANDSGSSSDPTTYGSGVDYATYAKIRVDKVWENDDVSNRPKEITVTLCRDGEALTESNVVPTEPGVESLTIRAETVSTMALSRAAEDEDETGSEDAAEQEFEFTRLLGNLQAGTPPNQKMRMLRSAAVRL